MKTTYPNQLDYTEIVSDQTASPYGPMDKAPAYGAGDSGFESQYGLFVHWNVLLCVRGVSSVVEQSVAAR